MDEKLIRLFETPGSIHELGLIVERRCDGELMANVAHVSAHSRSLECGYTGSGPADLALSALNAMFPPQELDCGASARTWSGVLGRGLVADGSGDGQAAAGGNTTPGEGSDAHAAERAAEQGEKTRVAAADGRDGLRATVRLGWDGLAVSTLAWELHHDFEAAFLASMDEVGGWVAPQTMLTWVCERVDQRLGQAGIVSAQAPDVPRADGPGRGEDGSAQGG